MPLISRGRWSRCTSCSRSWCGPTRRRSTSCTSRRPRRWSAPSRCCRAKLCTREERDAIADAIGAFRFTAGFGKTLSKLVRTGIGVHHAGHAAALPAPGRAARPDRPAEGDLRHRHARRRHQRPDPHGRLHRPGQVRRHQPPAAEGARVPPDRRPRRAAPGSTRPATSSCRRPSTRSRTRAALAKAGDDPKKAKRVQKVKAARRRRQLDRGDVTSGCAAPTPEALVVAHARQPRDDPQRHQPARATPSSALRALMEDNHEDERGRDAPVRAGRVAAARSCWPPACSSGSTEPDEHGRTLQLAPALQEDFALNQPLASFAQAAFELIDPESETYALDVLSVVESILDDPFPVLMAQAKQGARRGRRGDEGRRASSTRSGWSCSRRSPTRSRWPSRSSRRSRSTARPTRGCSRPTSRPSRSCATCTSGAGRSPSSSPTTASPAPRASCCAT